MRRRIELQSFLPLIDWQHELCSQFEEVLDLSPCSNISGMGSDRIKHLQSTESSESR